MGAVTGLHLWCQVPRTLLQNERPFKWTQIIFHFIGTLTCKHFLISSLLLFLLFSLSSWHSLVIGCLIEVPFAYTSSLLLKNVCSAKHPLTSVQWMHDIIILLIATLALTIQNCSLSSDCTCLTSQCPLTSWIFCIRMALMWCFLLQYHPLCCISENQGHWYHFCLAWLHLILW